MQWQYALRTCKMLSPYEYNFERRSYADHFLYKDRSNNIESIGSGAFGFYTNNSLIYADSANYGGGNYILHSVDNDFVGAPSILKKK